MPQAAALTTPATATATPGRVGTPASTPGGAGFTSLLQATVVTGAGDAGGTGRASAVAPAAQPNAAAAEPAAQAQDSQAGAFAPPPDPDAMIAAMLGEPAPASSPPANASGATSHPGAAHARAGKPDTGTDEADPTASQAGALSSILTLPVVAAPPPGQPAPATVMKGGGAGDSVAGAVHPTGERRTAKEPESADPIASPPATESAIAAAPVHAHAGVPGDPTAGADADIGPPVATSSAPAELPLAANAELSTTATGTTALAAVTPQPAACAAAQIAPVLVSMAGSTGGPQQLIVQLTPASLGRVEIRIQRAEDGTASIQVSAERPETLQMLQHDAASLQHTLDQAGLPAEGRSLTFSLAAAEPRPVSDTASGSASGGGGFMGGNAEGSAQQGGGSGQSGHSSQHNRFWARTADTQNDPADEATSRTPRAFAGINITA